MLKESEPSVYKLEEAAITYELNYEQFNLLKVENCKIEEWYNKLYGFAKKTIVRYGNIQTEDYGFYPNIQ